MSLRWMHAKQNAHHRRRHRLGVRLHHKLSERTRIDEVLMQVIDFVSDVVLDDSRRHTYHHAHLHVVPKSITQRQPQRARGAKLQRVLRTLVCDADRRNTIGIAHQRNLAHTGLIHLARQTQAQIGQYLLPQLGKQWRLLTFGWWRWGCWCLGCGICAFLRLRASSPSGLLHRQLREVAPNASDASARRMGGGCVQAWSRRWRSKDTTQPARSRMPYAVLFRRGSPPRPL
jgi:hypothetical protein